MMSNINLNMPSHILNILLFMIIGLQITVRGSSAWGGDRVLLSDIKVLTLHHGKMTTARRSSPVPQLNCISGTAGCSSFVPQVVQCHNQGSDGNDIQWECKSDMDNAYRFGNVEVTCEGYDYPDDPYVLKGSCGLEYSIDLTKEGHQSGQGHNYYGQYDSYSYSKQKSSGLGHLIMLAIICLIGYAIYKTCISNYQYSPGNDDYPGSDHRHGSGTFGSSSTRPPPPGFRPEYNPGGGCSAGSETYNAGTGAGGGGFWTGAATGGILGYLFGNSRGQTMYNQRPGYGGGLFGGGSSGYGFGGGSSGYGFGSSGGGSSGTRTASGFGGTRRR